MNYYFVKRYNPAYGFFIERYLREGGIDLEDFTPARARYRSSLLDERKDELTSHQRVFASYARAWGSLPDVRPTTYDIFWHILPEEPNLEKLKQLESQMPSNYGKLLLSPEETAKDLSNFYGKFIRDPLNGRLSREEKGRKVAQYLVSKELLPGLKFRREPEKIEGENQKAARELSVWLGKISPSTVLADLSGILSDHYESPFHMKPGTYPPPYENKKMEKCNHASKYLILDAYHNLDDDHSSVLLLPVRGLGQVQRGWENVLFPWYHVLAGP